MTSIETPSRIWRRIEANEAQNSDMPSLPSLPEFDTTISKDLDHSYFPPEPPYMHSPPIPPKPIQQPIQSLIAVQKVAQNVQQRPLIPDQVSLVDARAGHEQVSPFRIIPIVATNA